MLFTEHLTYKNTANLKGFLVDLWGILASPDKPRPFNNVKTLLFIIDTDITRKFMYYVSTEEVL